MRRIFLTLFLILGISFIVFAAEEKQEAPAPETSAPASAKINEKIVKAIEVKGNKSTSTNIIISKMKTHIGNPYQETVISDDLKRLYLLGYFSDIKIDSEPYKDGIKVIVTVAERPIIEKINFNGIYRITLKDEKLKEKLKSKEMQYVDYPTLGEDVSTLKKMYEKIGYSQANVTYKVDVDPETNRAKVEFTVDEGKKIRIQDIRILGNKAFSQKRILKLLKTKGAWFFNAGVLKDEVIKEDIDRVKGFYRRNGYADVEASYEVKPDAKKSFLLHVSITIVEGKKYLVGNVNLSGNKDIPEKAILEKLTEVTPGKVFSQEALKSDVSNIQGLYFDRGYITASVQDSTIVNPNTGRVDISYNITENEIAYVNKIKVKGNIKTKDIVIRRELRIYPGDKFSGDKLRRSKERLTNLGFFDEVSYDTEDTDTPTKKDLVVDVKESKTGSFSFGGGYSTVDSLVGFIEVEQNNFDWKNWPYFTGAGQNLKLRASTGTMTNDFDLSFTDPWVFDYPVAFGFDGYRTSHKRDTDVGYGYDEKVTGGDVHVGKDLTEYLRTDLTYRMDQINISNITDNASADLLSEYGINTIGSLTPAITFDTRDNVFDPHKGDYVTNTFEWAGLGGNKDFWKYNGRVSHYFPLPWNSVLEIKGRLGLASPYSDTERVPIYERFFAGGAYTIRGYKERALGPVDPNSKDPLGGNAMMIGNVEYTYPLFSFLKVAAFYDVGNVWEKIGDLGTTKNAYDVPSTGGFKSGFGLGVRIKTPIGPMNLDYGIPCNKASGEEGKGGGQWHFSASHGF